VKIPISGLAILLDSRACGRLRGDRSLRRLDPL